MVDDDPDTIEVLSIVLSLADYLSEGHTEPESALARLSSGLRPSLLIIDYNMQGTTGLELLASAREMGVDAPAMLLTAWDPTMFNPSTLNDLGIVRVLSKPYDPDALVEVLAGFGGSPRKSVRPSQRLQIAANGR